MSAELQVRRSRAYEAGIRESGGHDAQQYIEGVEYPASKEGVIYSAESDGAPESLSEMLGSLLRRSELGPEEGMDELRAFPGDG